MDTTTGRKEGERPLTFSDLRAHYGTGRAYLISQKGREKKYGYRKGIQTDIGDLEVSEWKRLVRELIERSGEQELQEQLVEWAKVHCMWLHTKEEVELYALKLHASRIFDNKKWAGYLAFNQAYRPEILKGDETRE
ncbi:MAG: hypothetical protein ACLVML_04820 [Candidatus Gastranaerophilaceae bacterium]